MPRQFGTLTTRPRRPSTDVQCWMFFLCLERGLRQQAGTWGREWGWWRHNSESGVETEWLDITLVVHELVMGWSKARNYFNWMNGDPFHQLMFADDTTLVADLEWSCAGLCFSELPLLSFGQGWNCGNRLTVEWMRNVRCGAGTRRCVASTINWVEVQNFACFLQKRLQWRGHCSNWSAWNKCEVWERLKERPKLLWH